MDDCRGGVVGGAVADGVVAVAPLVAALLAACLSAINITLAIRAYLRDRRPRAHPLSADLQSIAAAIRERAPDWPVRIRETSDAE
jgi:hypothetical protein